MPSKIRHIPTGRELGFNANGQLIHVHDDLRENLTPGLRLENHTPGTAVEEDQWTPSIHFVGAAWDDNTNLSVEHAWDWVSQVCTVDDGSVESVMELVSKMGAAGEPEGRIQFYDYGDVVLRKGDEAESQKFGLGGNLYSHWDDAPSVLETSTELFEDVIQPHLLTRGKGRGLAAHYGGIMTSSAVTRRLRCQFANQTIFDTGVLTLTGAAEWSLQVTIIAEEEALNDKVRAICVLTSDNATLPNKVKMTKVTGINLAVANAIKLLADCGAGAAGGEIVAQVGVVHYIGPDKTSMAFIC